MSKYYFITVVEQEPKLHRYNSNVCIVLFIVTLDSYYIPVRLLFCLCNIGTYSI